MNRRCIEMTHARRRSDAKRRRKGVLCEMKRLLRTIGEYACRHRERFAPTTPGLITASAKRTASSIASMRCSPQIPAAIKQTHERITGERRGPNAGKISVSGIS